MNNINELMTQYFECNNKIKDLLSEKSRIQAEIKLYMSQEKLEFYKNNGNQITYKSQKRKTLDKSKVLNFISEDKLNLCYKETEYSVLKVLSKESLASMKKFIKV